MEQLVARQAHNLEVARSNPASATIAAQEAAFFFFKTLAIKEQAITLILKKQRKDDETGIVERQRTEGLRG